MTLSHHFVWASVCFSGVILYPLTKMRCYACLTRLPSFGLGYLHWLYGSTTQTESDLTSLIKRHVIKYTCSYTKSKTYGLLLFYHLNTNYNILLSLIQKGKNEHSLINKELKQTHFQYVILTIIYTLQYQIDMPTY